MVRRVRTYLCQPCNTRVELVDERDSDDTPVARQSLGHQLRYWQCPGCCMHVHGRPCSGHDGGVSGLPLWLGEQLWTTARLFDDRTLLDDLFAVTREALAEAAATEVVRDAVEDHACKVLLRVVRGLSASSVPPHPVLAELLDDVETRGAARVRSLWRPFVEHPYPFRVDVTFRVRPPTVASMFAFEYRASRDADGLRLYTCYTVWRELPAGMEP